MVVDKKIILVFCFFLFSFLYSIEETIIFASDGSECDWFGFSVYISGNQAIIGAPMDDGEMGSAYIFNKEGENWIENEKITASDGSYADHFGWSVSISGEYAIIGAECDGDNGIYSGSAYIFFYDGIQWIEQAKLSASDCDNYYVFGHSVWINNGSAIIGAPGAMFENTHVGAVYVYELEGTNWLEQQKLIASDYGFSDEFGSSISAFGDYLIIGSPDNNGNNSHSGSAYIFYNNDDEWIEHYKLVASDGASDDHFGFSVSINNDIAVVGAERNDEEGNQAGAVYVFEREDYFWSEQAKITASYVDNEYNFGQSVSNHEDFIVVGSGIVSHNDGFATLFQNQGFNWIDQTTFCDYEGYYGNSVSLCDDKMIVGAYGLNNLTGVAYVYDISDITNINEIKPTEANSLLSNYPNPFNPTTTIEFSIQNDLDINLSIFNIKGQKIKTLTHNKFARGNCSIIWLGDDELGKPVSSGIYYYQLNVNGNIEAVKKCLLLK